MSEKQNRKKNIRDLERELRSELHEYRYFHDHKDAKGPCITPIKDVENKYIPNRHMYNETTVMCEDCEEIFDMESLTEDEMNLFIFKLTSAVNQMKIITNFNTDGGEAIRENLAAMLKFFDRFKMNFVPSYMKMVRSYSGGKNKNKGNNQRQKGHMGVSMSSFNR